MTTEMQKTNAAEKRVLRFAIIKSKYPHAWIFVALLLFLITHITELQERLSHCSFNLLPNILCLIGSPTSLRHFCFFCFFACFNCLDFSVDINYSGISVLKTITKTFSEKENQEQIKKYVLGIFVHNGMYISSKLIVYEL